MQELEHRMDQDATAEGEERKLATAGPREKIDEDGQTKYAV